MVPKKVKLNHDSHLLSEKKKIFKAPNENYKSEFGSFVAALISLTKLRSDANGYINLL